MPNWCYNRTIIYGDKEQVKELWEIIERETSENRTIKTLNSWGQDWLGNVFYYFYNDKEVNQKGIMCRGSFYDKKYNEQEGTIYLSYETAWGPNIESWEQLLYDFFPNLSQVTLAEECGCGIYVNTDTEGKFFKDKYVLDCCYQGENHYEYFESDKELVDYINEQFDQNFTNARQIFEDKVFQESFNVEDEDFFSLNEFTCD